MNLWIVVSDASSARMLSSNGRSEPLKLLRTLTHDRSRAKESDINTDRPGRSRHGPVGRGMYAMASSVRPKEVEARQFAREVASVLGSAFDRREYDSLALVAPARFLGMLTDSLDSKVKKHVLTRLDKDLTHIEQRDLPGHLEPVFSASEREKHRRVWQS